MNLPAAGHWAERAASFGEQAAAYARSRPHYPAAALRWVLPAGARRVVDLGAGTGRVSERLAELGVAQVLAVEPLAAMRAWVPRAAAAVVGGRAEAIPVRTGWADAVVVGQAYHWFDQPAALAEIARVLRPGGRLGLLWNVNDDRVDWVARLCELTGSEARLSLDRGEPPYRGQPALGDPAGARFGFAEQFDRDRLVELVASWSATILTPQPARERLLAQVRAAAPADRFTLPMVCLAWRGQRG